MDHSSQTRDQLIAALEAAQERVAALEEAAHELECRLAAQRAQRDLLQAMFDSAPNAIVMTNNASRIEAINRSVTHRFGVNANAALHTHVLEFVDLIKERYERPSKSRTCSAELSASSGRSCSALARSTNLLGRS